MTRTPGSFSFPTFAENREWFEVLSGRVGGQTELLAAKRESRAMFDSMKLEVKSLIIEGESAALEVELSGCMLVQTSLGNSTYAARRTP